MNGCRKVQAIVDDKLQASVLALAQLSPSSQEMVISLIRQLAERENIKVPLTAATGLQQPSDGLALWEADLITQNYSPNTIRVYNQLVTAYLKEDPVPTALSIKANLAQKAKAMSEIGVYNYIRALRSFFRYLKSEGLWLVDPTASIKNPKRTKKEREIPTEEEVEKLLKTLFSDSDWRRNRPKAEAWIVSLITTGLRRSELLTLTWNRVDLEHLKVKVMGKGSKERIVPISAITRVVLQEHRATLPEGEPRVFPTNDKRGVWDVKAANLVIERLCRKAGIKRYTAHQFRHFFTTYALKRGAKLEVISRMLGHANVGITAEVYRHVQLEEMVEEHQRFAPLSDLMMLPEGKDCK